MSMMWWLLLLEEEQVSSGSPSKMFLVGMAFVLLFFSMIIMVRTRRRVSQSQRDQHIAGSKRVEKYMRPGHQLHDQIGELMAELADLARQVNGQLDTRMARLEVLLRRADETMNRLAQNQAKADQPTEKNQVFSESPPPSASDWSPPRNPLMESPAHRQVLALFGRGLAVVDIAKQLGRPVGEVELILSLHGKKIGQ